MRIRSKAIGIVSIGLALLWSAAASALEWEIERNFRYFLYPSDIAAQRVARDIFTSKNGRAPKPEESELMMNGEGFWTTPLAEAGALRDRWPIDWPRDDRATVYDLVKQLRTQEGQTLTVSPQELGRLGWAALLAAGRDAARPTGFTDTCWNPGARLHTNCARWGDYARAPGWVVRVFDPQASAGQKCAWTVNGAVAADTTTPSRFLAQTQQALRGGETKIAADCRELRVVVASNPNDAKSVAGKATVVRMSPDGSTASLIVTPRDRLVVGFGDSFTSGEGNPERPALFNGSPWKSGPSGGANLPARDPDPTSTRGPDTRAQWTDRWCHRSVYSWQIRSALAAALSDPHQSVTILPYGCSGATILAGLLYEYNGVEWSHATDHNIIGSRAEIGLAYQELCQPQAFRSPYCRSGDHSPWCGPTAPPSDAQEARPGYYDAALAGVRRAVARCGQANLFKRSADAVLIDIGINDVGFASWVAGLILADQGLRKIADAFIPCFDPTASCAQSVARTTSAFDRLALRYGLLRKVLDQFLADSGVDPSHVIVAVYPPALDNEKGAFCPQGNAGLSVETFGTPIFMDGRKCEGSMLFGPLGLPPGPSGVITAYPANPEFMRDVEAARVKLNASLANFGLSQGAAFDVVNAYTPDFEARGICATNDAASRPPAGPCFSADDLTNVPCAAGDPPSDPESMHAPRPASPLCPHGADIASFHPFAPARFEPYRHRTRLYRTQNDVFMTINLRPDGQIDEGGFGTIDLAGRPTSGAFHPTAEAHAIIANETAPELCAAIGCGK